MSGGLEVRRSGHCAKGNHYDCSGHLGCDCECHAEPGPEVRQQLAEALPHQPWCDRSAAWDDDDLACVQHRWEDADALLPVVERIAAERTAEALREAAAHVRERHQPVPAEDVGPGGPYPRDMCSCGESFHDDCQVLGELARAEAMAAGRQEQT